MDQKKLILQLLEFNKTTFNNTYNTLLMLQDQVSKMTETLLNHPDLIPEEGKAVIKEWAKLFDMKKNEYQSIVNENFKQLEQFFDTTNQE